MGEVTAVLVPVGATAVPVPVAVAFVVVLLDGWTYGSERVTTAGAGAAEVTAAEVTAASGLEVLEEASVASVLEVELEVEDGEVTEGGEEGVPAGQSEPASAGGVHGIISK